MKFYTKKQLNQVFTKSAKDYGVHVDLKVEHQVRVSNGHWLVMLDRALIGPDFQGYFADVPEGECKTIYSYDRVMGEGPDFQALIKPQEAKHEATITDRVQDPFPSDKFLPTCRVLTYQDGKQTVEIWLDVQYFNLIAELFGESITAKVKNPTSVVYFYQEEELVSLLMPIKKWS